MARHGRRASLGERLVSAVERSCSSADGPEAESLRLTGWLARRDGPGELEMVEPLLQSWGMSFDVIEE